VERFLLRDVEPTGSTPTIALACRAGGTSTLTRTTEPTYPENPRAQALRDLRVGSDHLTLRRAAALLNLTGAELSAIEAGSKTFARESDWARAEDILRGACSDPKGGT